MTVAAPTAIVEIDFTTNLSIGWSYGERVLSDGPYVHFRLQESAGTAAADASGNGLTGTYEGTYTLNQTTGKPVTGESAARYILFGSGGRVKFTKPTDGVTAATLEAWVYRDTLDGLGTTFYRIAEGENVDAAAFMSFAVRGDGKLHMASGTSTATSSTAPIAAATWYHVAAVMDVPNGTVTFYVNGAALTTVWTGVRPGPKFQITGGTNWFWGGFDATRTAVSRIAEPALYTNALATSTILDHYNAAATVAFAGFAWTNVSADVFINPGVTRRFGRESQTEDVTPMELTYTLRNDDRKYEISNTASVYYPNVVAGRPTRIRMTQDGVTYDWAFGFIQDFPQQWDPTVTFGSVPIVANCFLARMNASTLGPRQFIQHLAGPRMTMLCNIAGVPTSYRTLDAGANQIMSQTVESGTVGDHGRSVARSDRGVFFFDGQGYAIFQDGNYRTTNTRSTVVQGTLDSLGGIPYRSPEFHAPGSLIRNEITLRRPGGVDQVAVDGPSRSKYGPKPYQDELLLTTDAVMATRAAALLADYKDPTLRVKAVTFNPATPTGYWSHALGVKVSDRYTWKFRPKQGAALSQAAFVEGVSDSFRSGEYTSTWFLSLV